MTALRFNLIITYQRRTVPILGCSFSVPSPSRRVLVAVDVTYHIGSVVPRRGASSLRFLGDGVSLLWNISLQLYLLAKMTRVWAAVAAILPLLFPSETSAAPSVSRAPGVSAKNVAGGRTTSSKGECFEYDVDFPGSDLAVLLNIPSPADCMAICGEGQGCSFWTYSPSLSECYIKSGSAFVSRQDAAGLVSGPRLCEYTDKCFDYGYDYTGYDVAKVEQQVVSTVSECQSLCYMHQKCAFFSWKSATKACYLKTSEAPMGRFKDSEVISGPAACQGTSPPSPPSELPNRLVGDSTNCSLSGSEYKAHNAKVVQGVSSAPACQVLCRNSVECYYWTWGIESKICSLKDELAEKALVSDKTTLRMVSGEKRCIPTSHRESPYFTPSE